MITIRAAQIEVFALAAVREFERQFCAGIRDQFPAIYEEFGENGLVLHLHQAEIQCLRYGISSSQGIRTWATLMLAFGNDFDSDEAWASELLASPTPVTEAERLTALFAAATKAAASSVADEEGH